MSSQIKALEAFAEDPELVRLESLLKRFNLFEAVGVVRHELRHSDFLAFLLDPSRNHGLGAIFLSEFLQAVRLTTLDLDALNLSHAYVFREWHHIDILVLDDVNHFAVIIENKVDTDEHSGQLSRYYADVRSHFPEHEIIALYLTSDGDAPSDDRYLAISYSQVCQIIEKIIGECHETLDVDVVVVIKHYAQMLRRHIVSDSDVAELCRTIYQKHRQALDLIFEHRPDRQAQIGQYVRSLIHQENQLEPGGGGKTWITFGLHDWKKSPRHEAQRFYVYFEFLNHTLTTVHF